MEKYNKKIPKGIRYISEYEEQYGFHLQDFPHILDKSIPGCGFTTWALTNSQNVILASPRKVLMKNKKKQLDKMKKVSFLCLPVEEEKQGDSIIDTRVQVVAKLETQDSCVVAGQAYGIRGAWWDDHCESNGAGAFKAEGVW